MVNKKKVANRKDAGVPLGRCRSCKRQLPRDQFADRVALLNGVCPWCKECYAVLDGLRNAKGDGTGRYEAMYKQYRRDYMVRYQQRRAKEDDTRLRDTTVRQTSLFNKETLNQLLTMMVPAMAVRDATRAFLVALMPALQLTNVWIEFEDELLEKLGDTTGVGKDTPGPDDIRRLLPVELYPELALVETNCYVLDGVKGPGPMTQMGVQLGLQRLQQAIQEACGYAREI